MEWAALILWIVATVLALPLGLGAAKGAPALGVQTVTAVAGLVLWILFLIFTASVWAWLAFAVAVVGLAVMAVGVVRQTKTAPKAATPERHGLAVAERGTSTIQLVIFAATAVITLLAAIGIGTVL
jgi:hypothetical protein